MSGYVNHEDHAQAYIQYLGLENELPFLSGGSEISVNSFLLQGDTLQRWRTEPFIMITGSGRLIPFPILFMCGILFLRECWVYKFSVPPKFLVFDMIFRWLPPPLPTAKSPDLEKESSSTYAAGRSRVC